MPLTKESLERLLESSPDIVVATDAHGQVAYYTDGARENLGYGREEIIGRFVAQLYPSLEEAKRVMSAMRDPNQDGRGRIVNFPTTFVAKDGREIPVAISGTVLYDEDGGEKGTIGFAKDLREFIRRDQLAVLGEIGIGLSHEINNPLAVITNQVELVDRFLAEQPASVELARTRNQLGTIRHEVARIEGHLRRLNEMAEEKQYVSTAYLGDLRMLDLKGRPRLGPDVLEGIRVLVVDDDAGVRESVAEILRADGCEVTCAGDAKEALRLLLAQTFDLVLSDVVMPEMDGYELFVEVRRRWPQTRMVLMTAFYYDKDHIIKRSRLKGLEGVIFKKPIAPARLRETLVRLFETSPRAPLPSSKR
jgi:PAS domain S-box-containing protein